MKRELREHIYLYILHDDKCNKLFILTSTENWKQQSLVNNKKNFFNNKKCLWEESNLRAHLISLVLYRRARRELYGFSLKHTINFDLVSMLLMDLRMLSIALNNGSRIGKYYSENIKYRINIYIYRKSQLT